MSDKPEQKKVVNLAEARQRQRTLKGASAGPKDKQQKKGKPSGPQPRLWVYLQLCLFLAVVGYMMTLCRGH